MMIQDEHVRLAFFFLTLVSICKASCQQEGHLISNARIIRSSFHILSTPGINSCVANCQMHVICRSFSYHILSHVCYLNYVDTNSSSIIMSSEDGYVSSDISTWSKRLDGPCSAVTCGVHDRCTVDRTGVDACSPVSISGDHPYILVLNTSVWETARLNCMSSFGGHLAIVDSIDKINFLTVLINATGDFFLRKFYIGASDIQEEGSWRWMDGSPLNFTYWRPGQPTSTPDQDCLAWKFGDGWRNRPCTDNIFSICERSF
ncbi:C-type mannose receptor 2-like [Haliotis rufescens]|uniref:C-type mannose receptor 2-like n=1 Tax=Haliotis rufescens TaxID=6454 RepID=UPI00201FA6DE|nr:C-type mannose receptor 2-like [Haliotis rufescens]